MAVPIVAVSSWKVPPPTGMPQPGDAESCAGFSSVQSRDPVTHAAIGESSVFVPFDVVAVALNRAGFTRDEVAVLAATIPLPRPDMALTIYAGRPAVAPSWPECTMEYGPLSLSSRWDTSPTCAFDLACAADFARQLYLAYGYSAWWRVALSGVKVPDAALLAAVDAALSLTSLPTMGALPSGIPPPPPASVAGAGIEGAWYRLQEALFQIAPGSAADAEARAALYRSRIQ